VPAILSDSVLVDSEVNEIPGVWEIPDGVSLPDEVAYSTRKRVFIRTGTFEEGVGPVDLCRHWPCHFPIPNQCRHQKAFQRVTPFVAVKL